MKKYLHIIFYIMSLIILAACGSGGSSKNIETPIVGGSSTTKLTITKTSLEPSESTTVKAVFTDNGRPVSGLSVTFSVTSGKATLNPASGQVVTDSNGAASVVLTAANAIGVGEVKVSASLNGSLVTKNEPFSINTKKLHLSDPFFDPSDEILGGNSTIVSVNVLDSNGVIYKEQAVDVYFKANNGFFVTENATGKIRSLNGVASVKYIYPTTVSTNTTDSISVNLGDSTVESRIVVLTKNANNITYLSESTPIRLHYSQLTNFTFQVVDSNGTGLPGKTVNFKFGGTAKDSILVPTSATSDIFGLVEVSVKAADSPTSLWVTAALEDEPKASAQSAIVTVMSQDAAIITATEPNKISITDAESGFITFTVTNAQEIPLPGKTLKFEIVKADSDKNKDMVDMIVDEAVTDADGNAVAVFKGKKLIPNSTASFQIKAYVAGEDKIATLSDNITVN